MRLTLDGDVEKRQYATTDGKLESFISIAGLEDGKHHLMNLSGRMALQFCLQDGFMRHGMGVGPLTC